MSEISTHFQASSPVKNVWREEILKDVPEGDMSLLQFERRLHSYWKSELVDRERSRIRETWFDYRHMHPVLRSHVFEWEYGRAYDRALKKFYGEVARREKAWRRKSGIYARKQASISTLLSRMHIVDEMCIPYDVFFDGAIEHMMQRSEFTSHWTKQRGLEGLVLPPLRTLCNADTLVAAMEHFERVNLSKLRLAVHPHYRASNRMGFEDQKNYAKYVLHQARLRGEDMVYALARLIYEKDALLESDVEEFLGQSMVAKVRAITL